MDEENLTYKDEEDIEPLNIEPFNFESFNFDAFNKFYNIDNYDYDYIDSDQLYNQAKDCIEETNDCKNFAKAFKIYQYLDEYRNHALAQYSIGILYLNNSIHDDYISMLGHPLLKSIIDKLREESIIEDRLEYDLILTKIFKENLRKAIFYLKKSANNGHIDAVFQLGEIYGTELFDIKDIEKSKKYLLLASEKDHVTAKTRLGEIYYSNNNLEDALKLYQEAANNGCAIAMWHVSNMYRKKILGPELSEELSCKSSLEWLEKSANLKCGISNYVLSLRYLISYNGKKGDENFKKEQLIKSTKLCLNAATQGIARAEYSAGLMYYQGILLKQDFVKAKEYFTKAAIQGVTEAYLYLAIMYQDGKGVNENLDKSINLYHKAAIRNNLIAKHNLGNIYYAYHTKFEQFLSDKQNLFWVKNFCKKQMNKNPETSYIRNSKDLKFQAKFLSRYYLQLEEKFGLSEAEEAVLKKEHTEHDCLRNKFKL